MTLCDRGGLAKRYETPKIIYTLYNIYYNFNFYVGIFIHIYTSIT